MTDDASPEAAGNAAGGPLPPARDDASFTIRKVPLPTALERQARRDAMESAIKFGAAPYRDAEGQARYVFFKEANNAPVEAWKRDREAKRGFRRTQQARKAAGQLIWHPEDQIELAKRLGVIYHREGRSVEGAAERGLYDAIWRYEHIWDSFTVPRRFGRDTLETGRIAAVAEEEARKLQAEDPKARGGFWVRDRKNNGLIYVVPNADPELVAAESAADKEVKGAAPPFSGAANLRRSMREEHRKRSDGEAGNGFPSDDDEKSEILAGMQGDIAALAREGTDAKRVRDLYRQQIKEASDDFMRKYLAQGIDAETAAGLAKDARDDLVKQARKEGTALARSIAEHLKKDPPALAELEKHYAAKLFEKPFDQLSRVDKTGVWEEVIRAAGRDNGVVSRTVNNLGKAARGLWVLSAAISAYNVLTADDKLKALAKEGVSLGGGIAGSALTGAAAGLFFGPVGVAIGVLVGGFAGAMGADIAFDALFEDN